MIDGAELAEFAVRAAANRPKRRTAGGRRGASHNRYFGIVTDLVGEGPVVPRVEIQAGLRTSSSPS